MAKRLLLSLALLLWAGVHLDVQAQSKKTTDLIKGLANDKNPKDRKAAAEELADLALVKASEAEFVLTALHTAVFKDSDSEVRKAALDGIGKIEPDKYVPFLIDVFKKEKAPALRVTLVAELARNGVKAKAALPFFHDALKTPLESGKTPANPSATKTQPPVSNPVTTADNDPQAVRKAILPALRQIEPNPAAHVPVLIDALKKDKDAGFRAAIVAVLGQIGPPAKDTLPVLQDIMKASLQDAQKGVTVPTKDGSTDPQGLRQAIVTALPLIDPNPKESVPALLDVFKKDKDAGVRQTTAAALGQIGPPAKAAVPALQEAYKTSVAAQPTADPQNLRKSALEALGRIEPDAKSYLPLLIDALKKERTPAVLQAAVTAVGQIGPGAKSAGPALREVLRASRSAQPAADTLGLRKSVLEVLAKVEPEPKTLVPLLVDTVQTDRDPEVRLAAVTALGKIGPPAKAALSVLAEIQKAGKLAVTDQDKALAVQAEAALKAIKAN